MRQVDQKIVAERKHKILQALIHQFIKTAKPVSSNILCDECNFELSSATIRNLMAEMEDEGFLTHPHTSSGRIPTDKGYRLYVDSIIELQRNVVEEEERVRKEFYGKIAEFEDLLVKTSHVLSVLSQYSGFVLTPKSEKNILKYLDLVRISDHQVLVIMITHTGLVKHKIINVNVPAEKLPLISRILNEKLRGLKLSEAKKKVADELEEYEREQKEVFAIARNLSQELFSIDEEIYLEGSSSVLDLPDFHDIEPMRSLFRLTENKDIIKSILSDEMDKSDIRVLIGSESTHNDLKDLSVVSSVYKDGENPVGILGIIGPKRMEYPKMMALVGAVSKFVNKMLSKLGG
jgi:heat-inducible transcriptional repressor